MFSSMMKLSLVIFAFTLDNDVLVKGEEELQCLPESMNVGQKFASRIGSAIGLGMTCPRPFEDKSFKYCCHFNNEYGCCNFSSYLYSTFLGYLLIIICVFSICLIIGCYVYCCIYRHRRPVRK